MTKPLSALFHPRPDITAHELAQIVRGFLLSGPITIPQENWDRIPPAARRHLDLRENVERIASHEFVDGSVMCAHCGATRFALDDGLAPKCPGPGNLIYVPSDGGHLWATIAQPDEFAGFPACRVCGLLKSMWDDNVNRQRCHGNVPTAMDAGALTSASIMSNDKPALSVVPSAPKEAT